MIIQMSKNKKVAPRQWCPYSECHGYDRHDFGPDGQVWEKDH